jgi:hypothetical protein
MSLHFYVLLSSFETLKRIWELTELKNFLQKLWCSIVLEFLWKFKANILAKNHKQSAILIDLMIKNVKINVIVMHGLPIYFLAVLEV